MIPYGRQVIEEDDIEAVVEVLRSPFLTQGPAVTAFEQALVDYTGAGHAVAVSSATAALHISCLSLGVGPGDIVWTSVNSFVASANCAVYTGASVDFIDIDLATRNLCVTALEDKLAFARLNHQLPKALIVVHFAGLSADMARIRALCDTYGVFIIEDASHALGSEYQGQKVGACTYSDVTVFSFHPVKNIAAGEGGAALSNDKALADRLRFYASHGITKDQDKMTLSAVAPCHYEQQLLGYNYRLSDLHAALGRSQLAKLDRFIDARQARVARYNAAFADILATLPPNPDDRTAWHIYVLSFDSCEKRDACFARLKENYIAANIHYIPIAYQPFYQARGFNIEDYPNAWCYYQGALTLPLYPALAPADQALVIDTVLEAV